MYLLHLYYICAYIQNIGNKDQKKVKRFFLVLWIFKFFLMNF